MPGPGLNLQKYFYPQVPCCVNTPVSVSNGTMDGMLLSDLIPFQFGGEGVS